MTIVEALERTRELLLIFGDYKECDAALEKMMGDKVPFEAIQDAAALMMGETPPVRQKTAAERRREVAVEELRRCQIIATDGVVRNLKGKQKLVVECFYLRARTVSSIALGLRMRDSSVKRIKREAIRKLREVDQGGD